MSRPRSRPTREETRERLLQAAAQLFADRGIGATTIEHICDAANFSRGAFYSNFEAKDELVLTLMDAHVNANLAELERLYEASASPEEFILATESADRRREGPLDTDNGGILYMELMLYALRNPENRPRIVERQRRMLALNKKIVQDISKRMDRPFPASLDDVAATIMALDEGFNLNQMIDPESYRPTQFSETLLMLHQLWMQSGPSLEQP